MWKLKSFYKTTHVQHWLVFVKGGKIRNLSKTLKLHPTNSSTFELVNLDGDVYILGNWVDIRYRAVSTYKNNTMWLCSTLAGLSKTNTHPKNY